MKNLNVTALILAFVVFGVLYFLGGTFVEYHQQVGRLTAEIEAEKASVKKAEDKLSVLAAEITALKNKQQEIVEEQESSTTLSIAELRELRYVIRNVKDINFYTHRHSGGELLDIEETKKDLRAVLQALPNLPATEDLILLGLETFMVETHLGKSNFQGAIDRYKNYGIAQFRIDTAESTIKWLKDNHKDVYNVLMDFKDEKLSLKDNLIHNTPFSAALMYQYYWRRAPRLMLEEGQLSTVTSRGELWKKQYNTHLGLGSVEKYVSRVEEMTKSK